MAARPQRLIAVVAGLLLFACGANAQPATRIVSLVPALTEMLFAIGAGPQVVGVSSYDDFPAEVTKLPRVGALLDPDLERILALRPDLVITYGSQTALEAQFTRAGIRTFSYRHGGIPTIIETLRELGAVTGQAAGAERTARNIQQQLDAVRARVKGRGRPRTLLVFERQPKTLQGMYVAGGQGFLNEMLTIAGGENVFADVQRESVQPSHETLLMRAPAVIVEVRATGTLAAADVRREQDIWSTLASIPAVRTRRVHFLNAAYLVVPGPRLGLATEAFARAIHPDAFK
jgi:iron complex transport system substrate-binding protein